MTIEKKPTLRGSLPWMAAAAAVSLLLHTAAAGRGLTEDGEHIYLTGYRSNGSALKATVQRDVPIPAGSTACANCHRRSGLGSAEGTIRTLPITSRSLFNPPVNGPRRPAYNDANLLRAITIGIASGGRKLSDTMPRYELTSQDAAALLAYLHVLGASPTPGVTSTHIDFATVIAADAPQPEQEAVEQVLKRFVDMKNSGSRHEVARSVAARRHVLGERRDRAFRLWRHEIWTLTGPSDTWGRQLERYYRKHPPFALVSGTAGPYWQVVHDFCGQMRLPCVLPLSAPAGEPAPHFYSLYFSDGLRRDARVTARHINETMRPGVRILLISSVDETGLAARNAFQRSWKEIAREPLQVRMVEDSSHAKTPWREWLSALKPDVLIAWLPANQFKSLAAALKDRPTPERIYTAETFTPSSGMQPAAHQMPPVLHVYPYRLPEPGRAQVPRESFWLRSQRLSHLEPIAAAHVLFACHALGEALMGIENNFSREYLLEQFEHMLDGAPMTSIYPATTLGPDQRVLTRGAYVLRLQPGTGTTEAEWVQM